MIIRSVEELDNLAGDILKKLSGPSASSGQANVLALSGDLGVGKTTFTQLILRRLGVAEKVTSPTFVILKSYLVNFKNFKKVWHMDCYRLDNAKELDVLGFSEIINDKEALIIIEWAEKIKSVIPDSAFWMNFKHGKKEGEREVEFKDLNI